MNDDVSPGILEAVKKSFSNSIENNNVVKSVIEKVGTRKVKFKDVHEYSRAIGEELGRAFGDNIRLDTLPDGKLHWHIAKDVIDPMIRQNHKMVMSVGEIAADIQNAEAGLKIGTVRPKIIEDRIKGLLEYFTEEDLGVEELEMRFLDQTTNITEHFFDQFLRENAEFKYQSGIDSVVIRTASRGCCEWCKDKAGIYDYSEVSYTGADVWRRHNRCNCSIVTEIDGEKKIVPGARTNRVKRKYRR